MDAQHRSLLELPGEILTQIARCSSDVQNFPRVKGHPMLRLSTSLRNAVFSSLRQLHLDLNEQPPGDSDFQPQARLLGRACCSAAPGLEVKLNLGEHCHEALPVLLQPALDVQGLHNVNVLELRMAPQRGAPSCPAMHQLGSAFPSLRQLVIDFFGLDLGNGDMLVGLQQCKQLSKLSLDYFRISPTAVRASAAALAQLPALRDLELLVDCDINLAGSIDQLTGLTSLQLLPARSEHVGSILSAAACNPGLQTFALTDVARGIELTDAEAVRHFLTSCPCLTHLDLPSVELSEGVVDAILTHGTSVVHLAAGALVTTTNYSGQPSNLQSLSLLSGASSPVLQFANLPLGGVTQLELWCGLCNTLAQLQLPTSSVPADQLPGILQRATSNLAACPAWQAKPGQCISLQGDVGEENEYTHLNAGAQMQLLEALAPLGGPHVRKFQGCVAESSLYWGRPEVEALGRSLNSTELRVVELSDCTLAADFWAALEDVVPSLEILRLHDGVTCSASDLAVLCSRRQAGRPFSLILAPDLYEEYNGAALQDSLSAQRVTHVSVVLETPHTFT